MTKLETLEKFILPELEIRISTFDKVNDPFELLGAIQGGKVGHRDFAWLKNHWTETVGFVSFSDNWKSPLMWAHYASNHTGVCLGIDVKQEKILKMEYQPRRVAFEFDLKKFETAADGALMERLTAIKFQEWEYEHEWRVLLPLQYDLKHSRPEYFYEPFTPDFELREIILGARCNRSLEEIKEQILWCYRACAGKACAACLWRLQHGSTEAPTASYCCAIYEFHEKRTTTFGSGPPRYSAASGPRAQGKKYLVPRF